MLLEIKKYPDSVLKKKAEEVAEITEKIRKLYQDMLETMIENDGVGLAAPQVGQLKRIIAVNIGGKPEIFINPKILKKSRETEIIEEGCLSFPGLFLKIKRAKEVEVESLNKDGKIIQIKAEGLAAAVLQHEIDHLDGILFIDRIPFWQKLKIKNKLKNFLQIKNNGSYRFFNSRGLAKDTEDN